MIKINVAEIKKRLVGKKDFSYELKPAELNITEADLPLTGTVTVKGTISNVGDVLLLEAMVEAMVNRTCGRCLKAFTGKSTAEVLEKFYPASAENIENDAFIYESDIVDLTEPIRESLLLAEPLQALCRIDCQGCILRLGRAVQGDSFSIRLLCDLWHLIPANFSFPASVLDIGMVVIQLQTVDRPAVFVCLLLLLIDRRIIQCVVVSASVRLTGYPTVA